MTITRAAIELCHLNINLFRGGRLLQQLLSFFLGGQCQHPYSQLVQTLYWPWFSVCIEPLEYLPMSVANRCTIKTHCTKRPEAVFIKSITSEWLKKKVGWECVLKHHTMLCVVGVGAKVVVFSLMQCFWQVQIQDKVFSEWHMDFFHKNSLKK